MLFQEATPDTSGYLIAGYIVAFLVMALYVASIYIRTRNLRRDETLLEDMQEAVPPARSEPGRSAVRSENHKSGKLVPKRVRKK